MPTKAKKAKRKLLVLEALAKHDNHKVYIANDSFINYANGEQYEAVLLYCVSCEETIICGHVYNNNEVENFVP